MEHPLGARTDCAGVPLVRSVVHTISLNLLRHRGIGLAGGSDDETARRFFARYRRVLYSPRVDFRSIQRGLDASVRLRRIYAPISLDSPCVLVVHDLNFHSDGLLSIPYAFLETPYVAIIVFLAELTRGMFRGTVIG